MKKLGIVLLIWFALFFTIGLWAGGAFAHGPSIVTPDNGQTFVVSYDPGIVHACTVFKMVEATESDRQLWPDGRYAPRSCALIDPRSTSYRDEWSEFIYDPKTGRPYDVDWEVYAELWTRDSETPVETNRVRVHK